jgi:hypothetical protein
MGRLEREDLEGLLFALSLNAVVLLTIREETL